MREDNRCWLVVIYNRRFLFLLFEKAQPAVRQEKAILSGTEY